MNYKVPRGRKSQSTQQLSNTHIMSHNFGNLDIVRRQYMVPGDKMKFDVSAFTRLLPLPCPTFSGLRLILRCFKVPLDFIFKDFSHFMSGDPLFDVGSSSTGAIPYTTPIDILSVFVTKGWCVDGSGYLGSNSDFFIVTDFEGGGAGHAFKLTSTGRRIRSFLLQLGYKLPHIFVSDSLTSSKATNIRSAQYEKMSLLPLLGFFKFYTDWVVPARFVRTNYSGILGFFNQTYKSTNAFFYGTDSLSDYGYTPSEAVFELEDLLNKLPAISFLYDDYFTSAFKTAYGPENASVDSLSGLDVVGSGTNIDKIKNAQIASSYDGQPSALVGASNAVITQLQLLSLGRLQKMVNKKKITDYHVLEWLRTEYGITPNSDALHMSTYYGSASNVIQIGDIMATATTDSSLGTTVVGQYAGKGLGGTSATWTVETDMHCLCFITAELQTKTSYVQGLDPFMKCLTRESFWIEEFDNLGVRAIPHKELVFDTFDADIEDIWDDFSFESIPSPNAVFGFAPRYSEFKYVNDLVSGDFACPSANVGMDSWYLSRKYGITDNPVISLDFCSASNKSVGSQYDRIFQNTDDVDHFYTVFQVGCTARRPMSSITDYFEEIQDEGNSVEVENNNVIG